MRHRNRNLRHIYDFLIQCTMSRRLHYYDFVELYTTSFLTIQIKEHMTGNELQAFG